MAKPRFRNSDANAFNLLLAAGVKTSDTRGVLSSSLSTSTRPSAQTTPPEPLEMFPLGAVTVRIIRSFNLFNFSTLDVGVTTKDGDTDVFPTASSVNELLDILVRKEEARFVMIDVDPAGADLLL
jgi:hypothetical protein